MFGGKDSDRLNYIGNLIRDKYHKEMLLNGPDYIPKLIVYVGSDYYRLISNITKPTGPIDPYNNTFFGFPIKEVNEDGYIHVAVDRNCS